MMLIVPVHRLYGLIHIILSQMSNKKRIYSSSSEEEDDNDNYIPKNIYPKSAVFNFKASSAPIIEDKNQELDLSREEPDEEESNHLSPKMKQEKTAIPNRSGVYLKNAISQQKLAHKEITAAYTFKLKSPATKKKKSDPVSLFQQTSSAWKKDKFLTSRGNNKQGRKLELDRRNKELKTIV